MKKIWLYIKEHFWNVVVGILLILYLIFAMLNVVYVKTDNEKNFKISNYNFIVKVSKNLRHSLGTLGDFFNPFITFFMIFILLKQLTNGKKQHEEQLSNAKKQHEIEIAKHKKELEIYRKEKEQKYFINMKQKQLEKYIDTVCHIYRILLRNLRKVKEEIRQGNYNDFLYHINILYFVYCQDEENLDIYFVLYNIGIDIFEAPYEISPERHIKDMDIIGKLEKTIKPKIYNIINKAKKEIEDNIEKNTQAY